LTQANKFGLDLAAMLKQLGCDDAKGATGVGVSKAAAVIDDN